MSLDGRRKRGARWLVLLLAAIPAVVRAQSAPTKTATPKPTTSPSRKPPATTPAQDARTPIATPENPVFVVSGVRR